MYFGSLVPQDLLVISAAMLVSSEEMFVTSYRPRSLLLGWCVVKTRAKVLISCLWPYPPRMTGSQIGAKCQFHLEIAGLVRCVSGPFDMNNLHRSVLLALVFGPVSGEYQEGLSLSSDEGSAQHVHPSAEWMMWSSDLFFQWCRPWTASFRYQHTPSDLGPKRWSRGRLQ